MLEGTTHILPPQASGAKGPGTRLDGVPFYNPAMAVNRDLSVLLVAHECRSRGRELDVADVLAGAGARSLRIATEVEGPLVVHANDADPHAIAAIEAGRTANHIPAGRLVTRHGNAHELLASRRFDIVDLDPYGSPMPFLDGAMRATRHGGLLCITATDTAALCGTYPKACRRRYGAEPLHRPAWRAEVGLRILQGAIVRSAGRFDRGVEPVVAVARGHWMRVVMRVLEGRGAAERAARTLGHVWEHPRTGQAVTDSARPAPQSGEDGRCGDIPPARDGRPAGPLWLGALHDPSVLSGLDTEANPPADPATLRLLERLREEADAPPFWVPLDTLAARLGGDIPRRTVFMDALRATGATTCRTHMDDQGVRTDADPGQVEAVWRQIADTKK